MNQSIINVSGADAFEFLQGQLSNDLARLDAEQEIYAAWCNPKGRVIWFGTVRAADAGYALTAPAELADTLVARLTMFRFRSKVEFDLQTDTDSTDAVAAIRSGVPLIGTAQTEEFTPHMLNLDLLNAVSFDKGCYTGQEIVARTHYKGATKRRMLRFSSAAPASAGDKVANGTRDVGEVLNAAGGELLAIVPLKELDCGLSIDGEPLQLLPLPYFDPHQS